MKRVSIAGIGAVVLITSVAVGAIPGVPNIWDVTAIAQNNQKSQVQLNLEAEKQVVTKDAQGQSQITWKALKGEVVVNPGDILRYTVTGENKGTSSVKNLAINQPIPKGMVYKLKSANVNTNAKITYSIDGGRKFIENPTVQVTLPNGKVETKPAPAEAYTHIRLNFGDNVAAKGVVKGSYQVQVR